MSASPLEQLHDLLNPGVDSIRRKLNMAGGPVDSPREGSESFQPEETNGNNQLDPQPTDLDDDDEVKSTFSTETEIEYIANFDLEDSARVRKLFRLFEANPKRFGKYHGTLAVKALEAKVKMALEWLETHSIQIKKGFEPQLTKWSGYRIHSLVIEMFGEEPEEPCTKCEGDNNGPFLKCKVLPGFLNADPCGKCAFHSHINECSVADEEKKVRLAPRQKKAKDESSGAGDDRDGDRDPFQGIETYDPTTAPKDYIKGMSALMDAKLNANDALEVAASNDHFDWETALAVKSLKGSLETQLELVADYERARDTFKSSSKGKRPASDEAEEQLARIKRTKGALDLDPAAESNIEDAKTSAANFVIEADKLAAVARQQVKNVEAEQAARKKKAETIEKAKSKSEKEKEKVEKEKEKDRVKAEKKAEKEKANADAKAAKAAKAAATKQAKKDNAPAKPKPKSKSKKVAFEDEEPNE